MEGEACNLKQNSQVRQNLKGLGFLIKSDWRMWLGLKLGRGWRAFHLLLRIANRAAVSTGLIYPFSRRSESRKRSSRGLAAAAQAHSPSHSPRAAQKHKCQPFRALSEKVKGVGNGAEGAPISTSCSTP